MFKIIKSHPRVVQHSPTTAQVKRRRSFHYVLKYWQTNYTDRLESDWHTYASKHPRISKDGHTYILPAYQQFLSINIIRHYNNVQLLLTPPSD